MKKKLLVFAALLVLALAVAGIASAIEVAESAFVAEGELDSITKVGGHEVQPGWKWEIYPTCTENGRVRFHCNEGDTTHDHYVMIPAYGHDWSSKSGYDEWGLVVTKPTCTAEGLAIDVCLQCGITNPDVTRTISKTKHEYDNKHYDVVKEPGCGEDGEGLGWKTCIWCGERHPDTTGATDGTAGKHLVILDKIAHTWSDWRVDRESTCWSYGLAARTCVACGALQHLSEGSPVVDQGKTITIGDVLPMKNEAWNVNGAKLDGNHYKEYKDLLKDLTDCKFEYEVAEDWLADCYTRYITYVCPYCHGAYHAPFTVSFDTEAHVWNEERDPYASVPAWCTTDGYDIFFCKYDAEPWHGHGDTTKAEDRFKKVVTKAVGHDWTEWLPTEVFTKEDKEYTVSFRSCNRCGATEQKTEEVINGDGKAQGLVQNEDGKWVYMIDGEIATSVTRLIPFNGGEFWVVNGFVATDANGLTICPDGKAYFLSHGQVQRVSKMASYNHKWFMLKNGELDKVTGLYNYDGGTFAVQAGRLLDTVDGLWKDPKSGKWAFLSNGQVQTQYSGEVTYDGATFTVVNGYLAD